MGTATVEKLTADEAAAERHRLLRDLGLTMDDLNERADDGLLDVQEFRVWRRVRTLNWLLEADD